jgi:soluble lytic murein transglycosylase-like protein
MGPLKLAFLALSLAGAVPARADPIDRWSDHIEEASRRFGIPETWIRRVMRAESGGNTSLNGQPIVSPAGAQGLMQLMPLTWRAMRSAYGLGDNPHDPHDNIVAGTAYLRMMYDRFGYPGLFAAYNAGPGRYAEHLASGRRLPAETVAYVAAVARTRPDLPASAGEGAPAQTIFVELAAARPREVDPTPPPPASRSLFVQLRTASTATE